MDEKLGILVKDIKRRFRGAKVYLFGSRARGDAKPNFDYDLIIVSKGFKPTTFVDRPGLVWRNTRVCIAADLICYTPQEFSKIAKSSFIIKDALDHAKAL